MLFLWRETPVCATAGAVRSSLGAASPLKEVWRCSVCVCLAAQTEFRVSGPCGCSVPTAWGSGTETFKCRLMAVPAPALSTLSAKSNTSQTSNYFSLHLWSCWGRFHLLSECRRWNGWIKPQQAVFSWNQLWWGEQSLFPGVSPCPSWNFPPAQESSAGAARCVFPAPAPSARLGSGEKGRNTPQNPPWHHYIIIYYIILSYSVQRLGSSLLCPGSRAGACRVRWVCLFLLVRFSAVL